MQGGVIARNRVAKQSSDHENARGGLLRYARNNRISGLRYAHRILFLIIFFFISVRWRYDKIR
jgi:hypothetical protein